MNNALLIKRAIEICGGTQEGLGKKARLTQATISNLLTGKSGVSAETAIKIEEATDGQVSRTDLRPDLFGKAA